MIRLEAPEDFQKIYLFVKEAFSTAEVTDGEEQEFVNRIRDSKNYLPELSFVAEEDGQIVGHIMLSKTILVNGAQKYDLLILAPLSVHFEYRGKGIGQQLIQISEEKAEEMGYPGIVLIGDPNYYTRFGFERAVNFDISPNVEIPSEYVLIKEVIPGSLASISGIVEIPS